MPEFNPTIHGNLRQPNNRGKANLKTYAGKRFNRLLVYGFLGMQGKHPQWLCRCDCGKWWVVAAQRLDNGQSQSCGCWNYDKTPYSKTHGMSKTLIHRIWTGIRNRIYNSNHHSYPRYGGKGLTLCAGLQTFEDFYAFVGEPPDGKDSLDRYPNNNGGYWCGQCQECQSNQHSKNIRWADDKDQARNRKQNVWLTANGKTMIASDWARELRISTTTIRARLRKGLSDAQALGLEP